jgi:short-subunit dehydrogenase
MTRPVALVTGASAGIGEEFARQLAAQGHDLVLVARDRARLEALAKELQDAHGATAEVLPADLTKAEELAPVEARAREVDLLINNAGYGSFGTFHELDLGTEVREVELNVVALMRLTHAAAGGMAARGKGGIINVSSLAGFQPGPRNATYSATKAFVTSFTEAVHEEMKGTGVSVCVLCPGFTRTEFQERANAPASGVPEIMWQRAPEVVTAALKGLAKNKAIIVPGTVNRLLGTFTSVSPHAVTRRASAMVLKRAEH